MSVKVRRIEFDGEHYIVWTEEFPKRGLLVDPTGIVDKATLDAAITRRVELERKREEERKRRSQWLRGGR